MLLMDDFAKYQSWNFSSRGQARRTEGSRGLNEPLLELNNEGLKTQTVDFQLLANSGGMENKLWVLNYPARKRLKYRESIKLLGEWVQVKLEMYHGRE